ncbi:hypothetical protein HRJ34_17470 [Rhizorhabdus wittichii]|uniref:Uncharacterized protein n=1 Tax=Rhizorhabdus wittichii TaxID=160791 RepID=A0A975CZK9_9SPHN|nr:hypothetical protein [Rhizorhabdus wittichii]QTH20139.1 hypothetical protein HRJ34_17470 [Rhizorhabdus wittichii]
MDGYRAQFLNRQGERLVELERIDRLLTYWKRQGVTTELEAYLAGVRDYREDLEPAVIAEKIARLRLMEDDIHLYSSNWLD